MTPGDRVGGRQSPDTGAKSECCKVSRSAVEFGLNDIDDELSELRADGESYRSLAEYFNVRLLREAIAESSIDDEGSLHAALVGDETAEQIYAVLVDEQGSDAKRAEINARLQNAGVDVDKLEDAFVSHVTMGSHVSDCLDVDVPSTGAREMADRVGVIRWARSRANEIIGEAVRQLRRDRTIRTGELDVELVVHVTCRDCGRTVHLQRLLDERQCDCGAEGPTGT
jgi:hypothetical protein